MKTILFIIISVIFIKEYKQYFSLFYAPEWEKQESIWLGCEDFEPYQKPFMDIIMALYTQIPLKINADNKVSL